MTAVLEVEPLPEPEGDEVDRLLDDAAGTPEGAVAVVRRGMTVSPELRDGLGVTIGLALLGAGGRVLVPILSQQVIDEGITADGVQMDVVWRLAAIAVGGVLAWWSGKRVAMTDMPQMIALYNGMGGGAAAAIAAVELYKIAMPAEVAATFGSFRVVMETNSHHDVAVTTTTVAVVGGIIGAVSFSGSAIQPVRVSRACKPILSYCNDLGLISSLRMRCCGLCKPFSIIWRLFALTVRSNSMVVSPYSIANIPLAAISNASL